MSTMAEMQVVFDTHGTYQPVTSYTFTALVTHIMRTSNTSTHNDTTSQQRCVNVAYEAALPQLRVIWEIKQSLIAINENNTCCFGYQNWEPFGN